jgi:hypothetical protein
MLKNVGIKASINLSKKVAKHNFLSRMDSGGVIFGLL